MYKRFIVRFSFSAPLSCLRRLCGETGRMVSRVPFGCASCAAAPAGCRAYGRAFRGVGLRALSRRAQGVVASVEIQEAARRTFRHSFLFSGVERITASRRLDAGDRRSRAAFCGERKRARRQPDRNDLSRMADGAGLDVAERSRPYAGDRAAIRPVRDPARRKYQRGFFSHG